MEDSGFKNPKGSKGNHKEFSVHDDCQQLIDLLLDEDVCNRMLKEVTMKIY